MAATVLRNAGLIDRDARMKDLVDKPGGKKSSTKSRPHRPKTLDLFKDQKDQASTVNLFHL